MEGEAGKEEIGKRTYESDPVFSISMLAHDIELS